MSIPVPAAYFIMRMKPEIGIAAFPCPQCHLAVVTKRNNKAKYPGNEVKLSGYCILTKGTAKLECVSYQGMGVGVAGVAGFYFVYE